MPEREHISDEHFWDLVNDQLRQSIDYVGVEFHAISLTLNFRGQLPTDEDGLRWLQLTAWRHIDELVDVYDFPSRPLVVEALGHRDLVEWTMISHSFAGGPMSPQKVLFTRKHKEGDTQRAYTETELADRIASLQSSGQGIPRYYASAMGHFHNEALGSAAGVDLFDGW